MSGLFRGRLVRLAASRPGDHAFFAETSSDSEYRRYQDAAPAMPYSEKESRANRRDDEPNRVSFHLRTVEDDRLIGFGALLSIRWNHRRAMLAIGIADRAYWGRGYGSDAVQLLLRYAFDELNLYRVGLNVWELNPRAVRAYEKAGFQREAVLRRDTLKDGCRSDSIMMGILQDEWRANQ